MSDDTQKEGKDKGSKAFDAFAIRNDKDGKGHFHKVGAAFAHKDGKGYDIDMVAAPTNGRLNPSHAQRPLRCKTGGRRA